MQAQEYWTTIVTYYKDPENKDGKPYHLTIQATSHIGSTKAVIDADTLETMVEGAKALAPVYRSIIEEAPIIISGNSTKGVRLEDREEALLLQALRGK